MFDDTRPYIDAEVPAAIARMADHPYLPMVYGYLFPDGDFGAFREKFRKIGTIAEFQAEVTESFIRRIVESTISGFSYSGVDGLDSGRNYMFIGNHRDIALDATLLGLALYENGIDSPEITFGSNLMQGDFVIDFGKLNKMFKIVRGGSPREFYRNSLEVSSYMRYIITEKGQSAWIAQRNGRTKDGDDRTEVAVLKMFAMSSGEPFVQNMAQLNITPVAISYEYEPCDFLKAREVYLSRKGEYVKAPGEDLNSILTGITRPKGNVCLTVTPTITLDELKECDSLPGNDRFAALAAIIDRRIYGGYRLYGTNFIAYDLLYGGEKFSERYSPDDRARFIARMETGLSAIEGDRDELREVFLGIYANPIKNIII